MTYKRIIQITDASLAESMADEAAHFRVTFRKARSGGPNEYVIEGPIARQRDIETIVAAITDMDAQIAEYA